MTTFIIIFILGISIGSFLNVCIYRMPAGISIVTPRSRCPKCEKMIVWYDNIPLLSWLLLRGKCRNCQTPISIRYFLVELLTGICFMLVFHAFSSYPAAVFVYWIVTGCLIVITFIDLDHFIIPDEISLPGIIFGLGFSIFMVYFPTLQPGFIISIPGITSLWAGKYIPLFNSLTGLLLGGGSLYLIGVIAKAILKKDAMGGGDVKLLAFLGAFLGWQLILLTIMLSSLVGSIIGSIQLYAAKKETEKSQLATDHYIPFGPYLALGAFISMIWGNQLIEWYIAIVTARAIPPGATLP